MILSRTSMLLVLMVIVFCGVSMAQVYKVGDSTGWTDIGHFDYKSWSATKTFRVGDSIVFEYNKQFHNVVRVTHKNFNACNATTTYATFNTGNDTFVIRKPGHFYFICSFPGHCQNGQKVDIRVPRPMKPSPSPSPSDPITPSSTQAPSPSPSPPSEPITPSSTRAPSPYPSPPPHSEPIAPSSTRAPSPSPSPPPSEPITPSSTRAPSPSPAAGDKTSGSSEMLFSFKIWLSMLLMLVVTMV